MKAFRELMAFVIALAVMASVLVPVAVYVSWWATIGLWLGFGCINYLLLGAWRWDPTQAATLVMLGPLGLAITASEAFD